MNMTSANLVQLLHPGEMGAAVGRCLTERGQTVLWAQRAAARQLRRATAEDITQEVLIRAHGRWDQIAPLDRPELYVRKMVLNEFLSWRRGPRRSASIR